MGSEGGIGGERALGERGERGILGERWERYWGEGGSRGENKQCHLVPSNFHAVNVQMCGMVTIVTST